MEPKMSKEAILECSNQNLITIGGERSTSYKVEFMVDSDFGVPGAITVVNKSQKEFFLESINSEGVVVQFVCNSWVQAEKVNANKRIFFSNKVNLFSH
jgi:lipoxygenase